MLRFWFMLGVVALLGSTAAAQSKEGSASLSRWPESPSVSANGMGQAGVMRTDNLSFYVNPATLGFLSCRYAAIAFYPGKTTLGGSSSGSSEISAASLALKLDAVAGLESSPFSIGLGYARLDLESPEYTEFGGGHGFSFEDTYHHFAIGVGYSCAVEVSLGLAYRHFSEEADSVSMDGDAFDIGLFCCAPVGQWLSFDGGTSLKWQSRLLGAVVLANYGPDIEVGGSSYVPARTRRIGAALDLMAASDRLIWLSVLPAFELRTLVNGDDKTTTCLGLEAGLAEILWARVGSVDQPDYDTDYGTFGVTVSTRGIQKLLFDNEYERSDGLGGTLLRRLNVMFSYARNDPEEDQLENTDYYSLEISF